MGCSPWGCKELDTTEQLNTSAFLFPRSQGGGCLGPKFRAQGCILRLWCPCQDSKAVAASWQ